MKSPLTVVNRGQSPFHVVVTKRDFVPTADGSLQYQDGAPYGASSWVTVFPEQMDIAPGASQVVTAKVTAPATPDLGDHQVAILFMVPAGQTKENIKVNRGVAMPVFVTVPGPIDTSVTLDRLSAPGFARRGPVTVTATVHSTGTVHRDFRAPSPLTVEGAGSAAPFPDFTVSRGATRDISTQWDPPLLCVCDLTVKFANDGAAVQTSTVRVVVFPWDLLAILLAAGLLTLLTVRLARRHFRTQVTKAAALLPPVRSGDG